MIGDLVTFFICAAIIIVAGTYLTKYADAIADLTGFGRLLVGSILLAGATSLPEMTVSVNVIQLGQPNLAVGNLMGACLFNLLNLAILDMSTYSRGRMLSSLASAHALSGLMTIALCSIATLGILVTFEYSVFGFGIASLVLIGVYLGASRLVYFDQQIAARLDTPGPEQSVLMPAESGTTLPRAFLGFLVAGAVIFFTAPYLAGAADHFAEMTGLGRSFVGTTLVAICTSLPELVASISALRLGAYDLAIGNVFGSNSFNMVMLGVIDAFQEGVLLNVVAPVHAITGTAVILVTAVAVMGQLYRVESRIHFLEPDAFLVVVLVLGALGLVYHLG